MRDWVCVRDSVCTGDLASLDVLGMDFLSFKALRTPQTRAALYLPAVTLLVSCFPGGEPARPSRVPGQCGLD